MKPKFLKKLLFFAMVLFGAYAFCHMPAYAAEVTVVKNGTCGATGDGSNVTWTLYSDGKLEFDGSGAMADYSSYSVPPWYDYIADVKSVHATSGVTCLGKYALYNAVNLASVELDSFSVELRDYCFYKCTALPTIDGLVNCSSIGEGVLCRCSGVTSVDMTSWKSSPTLAPSCFDNSCVTDLLLHPACTSIPNNAFNGLESLKYVNLADLISLTTIGRCAFKGTGLTLVELPSSVTEIDNGAFEDCKLLVSVSLGGAPCSVGSECFAGCHSLKSFTGCENVSEIAHKVFYFANLTEPLVLPGTDTLTLNNSAFSHARLNAVLFTSSVSGTLTGYGSAQLIFVPSGSSLSLDNSWSGPKDPFVTYEIVDSDAVPKTIKILSVGSDVNYIDCDALMPYYKIVSVDDSLVGKVHIRHVVDPARVSLKSDSLHLGPCACGEKPLVSDSHSFKYSTASDTSHLAVCSFCGFSKTEEHSLNIDSGSTECTCSEYGYSKKKCDKCGCEQKTIDVSKAPDGHNYSIDLTNKTMTCDKCGETHDFTLSNANIGLTQTNVRTTPSFGSDGEVVVTVSFGGVNYENQSLTIGSNILNAEELLDELALSVNSEQDAVKPATFTSATQVKVDATLNNTTKTSDYLDVGQVLTSPTYELSEFTLPTSTDNATVKISTTVNGFASDSTPVTIDGSALGQLSLTPTTLTPPTYDNSGSLKMDISVGDTKLGSATAPLSAVGTRVLSQNLAS